MKTHKQFIDKVGGITYNLPQITEKFGASEVDETISYLVKSLRKPSFSQNTKSPKSNLNRLS